MPQTYAFDAADLLLQCQQELQDVIEADERRGYSSHYALYDMKEALLATDVSLYRYFQQSLEQHQTRSSSSTTVQALYVLGPPDCLSSSVSLLRSVLKAEQQDTDLKHNRKNVHVTDQCHAYYPIRSATDSLLFRLVVALQLCLVRIDDARFVVTGNRQKDASSVVVATHALHISLGCIGAMGFASLLMRRHHESMYAGDYRPLVLASAKLGLAAVATTWLRKSWRNMWMTSKIVQSTREIERWKEQWDLVQSAPTSKNDAQLAKQAQSSADESLEAALDAAMSRRLVEYALHHTPESSVWHSQGELRFLMLKRAMDIFYASVGAAIKVTDVTSNWQTTLATAAAASFYSLTGASRRASQETSSSSARDLIQSAWGMVSLPAIKNLSLQASRILKGAAVADRIEIMSVSCFVLSREPAPEMAAAIKRFHRQNRRKNALHTALSTIDETTEHNPDTGVRSIKPFARTWGHYRQRDVIFHLTGGGFFAHIIASDLPYLLDWSASTGGVVICPEYALLPDHKFPDALLQVEDVYRALRQGGAVSALGFEANRIVVTGESAGGNLAAALCVKICMDNKTVSQESKAQSGNESTDMPTVPEEEESAPEGAHSLAGPVAVPLLPLPDALMLSCAVLNLSLELSYSRVVGTGDPVLPSGLISAISDAYLPIGDGVDKKDPLASPFFALDAVLCQFPPTLLFASSNDPLLDDSVVFNQRLRSLGVESELRAAQNLPHAYLGLGTAGFPEAQQVQQECQEWLKFQFTRHRDNEVGL